MLIRKKRIVAAVISELTTDQRLIRICTTLQGMGFEVLVIARQFNNSLPLDSYAFSAQRIWCYFKKGFMQYAEFNTKLFFKLLFTPTDYFLANDLDTLLPNFIASKLKGKKLFYDTHEYFTGVPELAKSPLKKKVWKMIEDFIFPRLPVVYTINNSVRDKYEKEYGNKISVVRNVPTTEPVALQPLLPHWQNKIILLMQGMGINPGRGGMELLEMMKYLPDSYHLIYIGGGLLWNDLQQNRAAWGLLDRVDMIDKLPPHQLRKYTPLAHVGFTLDGFNDDNFLMCLPNKIFDYVHANVPVAAYPVPEVKQIIEQYHCGFCFKSLKPEEMAMELMNMMNDNELYQSFKQNTVRAAKDLCWENESKKLMDIYAPYL